MNNGGPAKWTPLPHPMIPGPRPSSEELAYDRGVTEGIRFERNNQLRDMAKAAMPIVVLDWRLKAIQCSLRALQDNEHVRIFDDSADHELAHEAFNIAEAMLAESDKRRSSRDETL